MKRTMKASVKIPAVKLYSLLCFMTLFILYCKPFTVGMPKAAKGELDLRNISPSVHSLYLDGEWEFYPKEFLPVSEAIPQKTAKTYLPVPGNWNSLFPGGSGYGTYRLKVKLPAHWDFPLALKLFNQGTAYRLFVNQKEIAFNGTVGASKEESVPNAVPLVTSSFPNSGSLDIICYVSNFHFREGGLWYPTLIGSESILRAEREKNIRLDIFLLGSILIMGVYHSVLYLIRKKDPSPFWFGLFCFDIIFRLISFNEKYIVTVFPDISHLWATRIEYWAYYFAVPLFAQFLYSLFPDLFSKKAARAIWTVTAAFSGLVLFTGAEIFTHSAPVFHICTLSSALYFIYVIARALLLKKESAFMLLLGTGILIGAVANDILYSMEYIKTFYIVPQALLFFIFIQSILLSMRFSRAFTENEKLTASLFELNESLEKKVMERTLEYRLEKEKAEQAGKIKDKFVSIVSHDLRTPMIGVSNLIDILRAKTYVQSEEDKEGLLKMCSDSVQHSLEMIKQLLNFSRVETGTLRLKLQKIDPADYIESIVKSSTASAKSKNIEIKKELDSEALLFIDPEVFSNVLKNLISNSLKFTSSGGTVWIRISRNETQTRIEVQDNGIGMSPESLNNLFDPEKVKSRLGTEGETGHGMGLFICKYIVEAHKGEIEFQAEQGKGFLSIIKIPIHD